MVFQMTDVVLRYGRFPIRFLGKSFYCPVNVERGGLSISPWPDNSQLTFKVKISLELCLCLLDFMVEGSFTALAICKSTLVQASFIHSLAIGVSPL